MERYQAVMRNQTGPNTDTSHQLTHCQRRGSGLSISRMTASPSQDMVTAIFLQQEARGDEERKLDWERREGPERKWQEMERQNRE